MPQQAASKPVLAVDIDEVLVPFMEGLFQFMNAQSGTNYKVTPDMPYYSAHQFVGDTVEQFQRKIDDFVASDGYRESTPIKGAIESLRRLKQRYTLVIITARPKTVRELTEDWVRSHFPATFSDVHFVPWVEERPPDKQSSLHAIGAYTLIDDNLSHIQEAADGGVQGILFGNYPWNQVEKLPKGVSRASTWVEVEGILL